MKQLLLSLALPFFALTSLQAQISFASPVNYGVGSSPYSVTTGDFNGDGKTDLAAANYSDNNVSVLLNNGDGTFSSQVTYAVGLTPYSVTAGDFNGDGKTDLATANSTDNTVSVLLNKGDSTFASQVTYTIGNNSYSITTGDFNGDGKTDLAAANYSDNNVSVLLNNGDGTFASQVTYAVGRSPKSVLTGDFNNDGKTDLATANSSDNNVSVLINKGDSTFATQVIYAVGTNPYSISTADFNGDGKPDLVTSNVRSSSFSVLLNNGNSTFATQETYTGVGYPYSITAGDYSGDGKPDLATVNFRSGTVNVMLNNGDSTFATLVSYTIDSRASPLCISTADFNGDGKPDLITANRGAQTVSVLLNNTTFPLPVTLVSFTGSLQNRQARLQWQTGTEEGFQNFEIEKSTDGNTFAAIGTIDTRGSNSKYTFSMAQEEPVALYQLKMKDKDGRVTYSKVISLSQGAEAIRLYPNPATNAISITSPTAVTVMIYNASGILVKTCILQAGVTTINISQLSKGMYYCVMGKQRLAFTKQ